MNFFSLLAWALWLLSGILYVLYVLRGVWRRVFWESTLLLALGCVLASVGVLAGPGLVSQVTLALLLLTTGGFLLFTLVLIRTPESLRLEPGDRMPHLDLPDQEGRRRSLDSLVGDRGLYLIVYRGHW